MGSPRLTKTEIEKRLNKLNLQLIGEYDHSHAKSELLCHCGKIFYDTLHGIFSRNRKSCGCLRGQWRRLTPETISKRALKNGIIYVSGYINGRSLCKFKCHCGKIFETKGVKVTNFDLKGCGCDHGKKRSESHHWRGHGEISGSYLNSLESGAKNRGLEFKISLEDMWDLFIQQNRKCALSGLELSFSTKNQSASLDRINSNVGYVLGNIQWVHRDINKMKIDLSNEEFINWCSKVALNV